MLAPPSLRRPTRVGLLRSSRRLAIAACHALGVTGCGPWGGGSEWIRQPLLPEQEREAAPTPRAGPSARPRSRTIGARATGTDGADLTSGDGRVLGTFRNTYYDFPSEPDHTGAPVALMNGACETIAKVPRGFHDAVCVQGSGSLAGGTTVSFAKRDCPCAEICPRTGQRICFDALDTSKFPWGRGARGTPIMPLRSVAADTTVLPMGTVLYIPELDGIARVGESGTTDGCFVVEDRGLRVRGEHVDIFTGHPSATAALSAQVPTNRGVTVVVDAPKCAYLEKR